MRRALLVVALAACGGEAPTATQAPSNQLVVTPRATPAPAIAWDKDGFKAPGLPAVARGGEAVVTAIHENDGGRGYPSLRLEVRDRTDKLVQTIAVMTPDEYERLAPGGTATPELAKRIDEANRELAKLHGVHDLVAMHALEVQTPAEGKLKHLAIGDGFDVDFAGDHLHVFRHNANNAFITLPVRGWLAKPRTAAGVTCENPAFLQNVFHAAEINVLLVVVAYTGTDTCWEPTEQFHVIAW